MNNGDLDKEVKKIMHTNLYKKGYVCAVDILIQLEYLSIKDYEDWRFGKVAYLEKVCTINLSKLTLINKTIRKYATELDLESSWTAYNQFGKGIKRRLRFSKSGDETIEDSYSTHFIDKKRINELKKNKTIMLKQTSFEDPTGY